MNPIDLRSDTVTRPSAGMRKAMAEAEEIERAANVRVKFQDVDGTEHEYDCDGLLAIAVQHETDHLHGIMVTDHISALKRELIRKRMKRLKSDRANQRDSDSNANV